VKLPAHSFQLPARFERRFRGELLSNLSGVLPLPELSILRFQAAYRKCDQRTISGGRSPLPTLEPSGGFRGPRELVMENTGLEPVTSWLQTRRSPS
jgi:hypothetical protein